VADTDFPPAPPVAAALADMLDCGDLGYPWLGEPDGPNVVAVPGSAFYRPGHGGNRVRFAFCKSPETMAEADLRLRALGVSSK
jgi:hypothetical protein